MSYYMKYDNTSIKKLASHKLNISNNKNKKQRNVKNESNIMLIKFNIIYCMLLIHFMLQIY